MKSEEKINEFHIGSGKHLVVKSSTIVEMHDSLRLMIDDAKAISLDIEIKTDFSKIPSEYHEVFLQMMSVRYGGIVNLWDNTNPFSKPVVSKKKWYQIWKH